MDFMTAVRTCLSKYVDFSGRARRSEFWFWVLFNFLVGVVANILDSILGTDYDGATSGGLINTLVGLALFLPSLAVAARRLHDTGRSGWWLLLILIPVLGWIALLVFYCLDSTSDNQYGPNPKREPGAYQPPTAPPPYGSGQYGG